MKNWISKSRVCWNDRSFIISFLTSFLFLTVSFFISFYAGLFATRVASASVTDILLSHIPVFDVDGLFVIGTLVVTIFTAAVLALNIKTIPFAVKTLALFIAIRSIFIVLTHIGPFPLETAKTSYDFVNRLFFGADQFFSGHTGMPFLGALVFWDNKVVRYLYLASSVYFAVIVILGHLHYSIDVLSAYFITYSIFQIALYFFKKDRKLFLS